MGDRAIAEITLDPAFDGFWPGSLHAQILCREAETLLDMKEEKTHQKDTKDTKKMP